jgi:hypothetical protein
LSAMRHKPFHPVTALHQRFLQDTLKKLDELKTDVNVEREVAFIKQQLTKHSDHD